MSEKRLPVSGYAVVSIVSTQQELKPQQPGEDSADHGALRFGWDWRRVDERVFDVRISVAIEPSMERREYVSVNVIGRFRQVEDAPRIPVERFARLQAVAMLLPYARQYLSSLTTNSPHGTYYLPSINVVALMEGLDPAKATAASQAGADAGKLATSARTRAGTRPSAQKKK